MIQNGTTGIPKLNGKADFTKLILELENDKKENDGLDAPPDNFTLKKSSDEKKTSSKDIL